MSLEDSPGVIWLSAFLDGRGQWKLSETLALDSAAKRFALAAIGAVIAPVVVLGDSWREASADEAFADAILLPVAVADPASDEFCGACLRVDPRAPADVGHLVCDVIAIPVIGEEKALSLTGMTAALGVFAVSDGKCRLVTSPLGFLRRYLERFLSGDERLPDAVDTLVADRDVFEWRVSEPGCVVPKNGDLACVDSTELAAWLVKEMRRRGPVRKAPQVLAPKGAVA